MRPVLVVVGSIPTRRRLTAHVTGAEWRSKVYPGRSGGHYDAAASSLSFSFRRMLTDADEPVEEVRVSHRGARTEAIRAQEVFEQFLNERTRQAPGIDVWAMLLSSGKGFLLIGDVLDWLFEHGYTATRAGAPAVTLATVADMAVANIVRLAEETRSGHRLRVAGPLDASGKLRSAALASVSDWR
jgi:hypothetical protein